MYHLRLIKALSYTGVISATKKNPDAYTDDKEIADKAVASGYFELVEPKQATEENPQAETEPESKTLNGMNTSELETYATYKDISLKGLKKKADIIERISETLGISPDDEITDFGSPTMVELQEK